MTDESYLEDAPFYFNLSAGILVFFCLLHPLLHTGYVKSKLHGALRYVLTSISLFVLSVATGAATAALVTTRLYEEAKKISKDPMVQSALQAARAIFGKNKPANTQGSD